jgi:hypothetical protein
LRALAQPGGFLRKPLSRKTSVQQLPDYLELPLSHWSPTREFRCWFCRWLKSGLAAVDWNGCSTDERSLVGCDKKDGIGDFFRTAQAFERNAGGEADLLLVRPSEARQHFRFDRARCDDIHPDTEWRPFQSCRLSESFDRMLAGNIKRGTGGRRYVRT